MRFWSGQRVGFRIVSHLCKRKMCFLFILCILLKCKHVIRYFNWHYSKGVGWFDKWFFKCKIRFWSGQCVDFRIVSHLCNKNLCFLFILCILLKCKHVIRHFNWYYSKGVEWFDQLFFKSIMRFWSGQRVVFELSPKIMYSLFILCILLKCDFGQVNASFCELSPIYVN
jgi:hypothetical protein